MTDGVERQSALAKTILRKPGFNSQQIDFPESELLQNFRQGTQMATQGNGNNSGSIIASSSHHLITSCNQNESHYGIRIIDNFLCRSHRTTLQSISPRVRVSVTATKSLPTLPGNNPPGRGSRTCRQIIREVTKATAAPSAGHSSQPLEQMDAIPRWIIWTRPLRARTLKGVGQKSEVLPSVHLSDAKTGQMWGTPLDIKKPRAEFTDQPHQSRLGSITAILWVVEHGLSTEKSPDIDAIEAPYQTTLRIPSLN